MVPFPGVGPPGMSLAQLEGGVRRHHLRSMLRQRLTVLGIETSCDETAVAVVVDGGTRIRANLVQSQ
ncbi:MAG: hypothetical protein ACREFB_07400, partial [Stellaceae bacterium]